MTAGTSLAALGAILLIACALFALFDAARTHFLKRAEVDGRTRMKVWPLWVGIAGGVLLLLSTWVR